MKVLKLIGKKREQTGKKDSKKLRQDGFVPCNLYGENKNLQFYLPLISFRDVVYTMDACKVELNIEGNKFDTILQDAQFHPVTDYIEHADFLEISDKKQVIINIPIQTVGQAAGIVKGGKMFINARKLKVKALPQHLPDHITIDINKLDLGDSIMVKDIKIDNLTFLDNPTNSVVSVKIPRLLKVEEEKPAAVAAAPVEGEEGAPAAAGATATTPAEGAPKVETAKTPEKGKEKGKGKQEKKEKQNKR